MMSEANQGGGWVRWPASPTYKHSQQHATQGHQQQLRGDEHDAGLGGAPVVEKEAAQAALYH
jgi:hypothetical protein